MSTPTTPLPRYSISRPPLAYSPDRLLVDPNSQLDELFAQSLLLIGSLSTIVHSFLLYASFRHTPRQMPLYRFTVTNTNFWSLLVTVECCFVLRPIPQFPFFLARIDGPRWLVGSFELAERHWLILLFLIANLLVAFGLCFLGLCLYLTQSRLLSRCRPRRAAAWLSAIALHLVASIGTLFAHSVLYPADGRFLDRLLADHPEVGLQPGGLYFGFYPTGGPFLSAAAIAVAAVVIVGFVGGFGCVVRALFPWRRSRHGGWRRAWIEATTASSQTEGKGGGSAATERTRSTGDTAANERGVSVDPPSSAAISADPTSIPVGAGTAISAEAAPVASAVIPCVAEPNGYPRSHRRVLSAAPNSATTIAAERPSLKSMETASAAIAVGPAIGAAAQNPPTAAITVIPVAPAADLRSPLPAMPPGRRRRSLISSAAATDPTAHSQSTRIHSAAPIAAIAEISADSPSAASTVSATDANGIILRVEEIAEEEETQLGIIDTDSLNSEAGSLRIGMDEHFGIPDPRLWESTFRVGGDEEKPSGRKHRRRSSAAADSDGLSDGRSGSALSDCGGTFILPNGITTLITAPTPSPAAEDSRCGSAISAISAQSAKSAEIPLDRLYRLPPPGRGRSAYGSRTRLRPLSASPSSRRHRLYSGAAQHRPSSALPPPAMSGMAARVSPVAEPASRFAETAERKPRGFLRQKSEPAGRFSAAATETAAETAAAKTRPPVTITAQSRQIAEGQRRSRIQVFEMLTARCLIPMFLLFVPVIVLAVLLIADSAVPHWLYLTLCAMMLSHGMFNSAVTICIFRPYRELLWRPIWLKVRGKADSPRSPSALRFQQQQRKQRDPQRAVQSAAAAGKNG